MLTKPRLIVYELNEVPPSILLDYCTIKPNSYLAQLVASNNFLETVCSDIGELHPWSTWPTLHRGVSSSTHNIRSLNQDLSSASKYPPIWETLLDSSLSIGIFGALHSYPCPSPSPLIKFYLPDTFAPSPESSSKRLTRLQEFNLRLSSSNKALSRPFNKNDLLSFIRLVFENDVSINFAWQALSHLFYESINPVFKERRSFLQPSLLFNRYVQEILCSLPDYSSFFTNHVAGVMHRYWCYAYPHEYNDPLTSFNLLRAQHIWSALDLVDAQLTKLQRLCLLHNYDLWILSSMGQKAVPDYISVPELFLDDVGLLLNVLCLDSLDVLIMPSMHPDVNFRCKSLSDKAKLIAGLRTLVDPNGECVIPIFNDTISRI